MKCNHFDQSLWRDSEPRGRYVVTTCAECGGFIGRRPVSLDKKIAQRATKPSGYTDPSDETGVKRPATRFCINCGDKMRLDRTLCPKCTCSACSRLKLLCECGGAS